MSSAPRNASSIKSPLEARMRSCTNSSYILSVLAKSLVRRNSHIAPCAVISSWWLYSGFFSYSVPRNLGGVGSDGFHHWACAGEMKNAQESAMAAANEGDFKTDL